MAQAKTQSVAIQVSIQDDRHGFWPGETIAGTVSWASAQAPSAIEVRLIVRDASLSGEKTEVAERLGIKSPAATGSAPFSFIAPAGRNSFYAKVVCREWGVEAVAEPSGERAVCWIAISHTGKTIMFSAADDMAQVMAEDAAMDSGE